MPIPDQAQFLSIISSLIAQIPQTSTPLTPTSQTPNLFNPGHPPAPSYTLATVTPVDPPHHVTNRPSPVPLNLRQQILNGGYIDLAELIQPSISDPHRTRDLLTPLGLLAQLRQPLPSRSKDLTAAEFAFAFSLYRDVVCSSYPSRRTELDQYLTLILDLAIRFGGTGFYNYHVLFATRAAACVQQNNEATYWGALDQELYCRVFSARASLSCELCGAPSHPASGCTTAIQTPRPKPTSTITSRPPPLFPQFRSAAPPPSIVPRGQASTRLISPSSATDKQGRPIVYQSGRMVCNNYNHLGCSLSSCRFLHVCSFCGGAHSRPTCPHNPTA